MTFSAVFALAVGVLMFAQWGFFLATGKVPEIKTEPIRIRFHIADELLTAAALVACGIGMLAQAAWAMMLYPVALGMLIYTVIVSAGYFAEKRTWPVVVMFAVILSLALVSLVMYLF